jgi:hypothetical protein
MRLKVIILVAQINIRWASIYDEIINTKYEANQPIHADVAVVHK